MTHTERHQLGTDAAFIARVQIAATQVAIGILSTPDPDPIEQAAARGFLRESSLFSSRLAVMAAAVVEDDDVTDVELSTLLSDSWSFLSAVFA